MFLQKIWEKFWMRRAGLSRSGRCAAWLASLFSPPYKSSVYLAHLTDRFFVSPEAIVNHPEFYPENNVFVGAGVIIHQSRGGGPVRIGRKSHLHRNIIIETGEGGQLLIGMDTHIQPRCQFSAYKGKIVIGNRVQIGPNCVFYPYNHGTALDESIKSQPLTSKGDIVIEDDVWLGYGVIVLEGVRIGHGAVVGAGSVVTRDIGEYMVAAGVPAKTLRKRGE